MYVPKKDVEVLFFMEMLPSGGLEKSLHTACWFNNTFTLQQAAALKCGLSRLLPQEIRRCHKNKFKNSEQKDIVSFCFAFRSRALM